MFCICSQRPNQILVAAVSLLLAAGNADARAFSLRLPCATDDGLAKGASWQASTETSLVQAFSKWLSETEATRPIREQATNSLRQGLAAGRETLDLVVESMAVAQPQLKELLNRLDSPTRQSITDELKKWTEQPDVSDFVKNHARLYAARWLARHEFYDEALSQLRELTVDDVVDPASLLFYRGLMEHQLLLRDECMETLQRLLEHEEVLPRRFKMLSRLMLADIEPLEPDSLDEISRLMHDIRRRTGLYRSGKIVLSREQEVINKLDKLIENLEAQRMQPSIGQSNASRPMEDSSSVGGQAEGDVQRKSQTDGGSWGNLPPAQRAAALAEMAKQMPPHYRAVIEEYFRQLASEPVQ